MNWLPKYKCALYLSHNDHKSVYEDIDSNYDISDFISPEEYEKAIAEDSVWHLQWYPNTPVGFTSLLASSLEALQKHVEQMNL